MSKYCFFVWLYTFSCAGSRTSVFIYTRQVIYQWATPSAPACAQNGAATFWSRCCLILQHFPQRKGKAGASASLSQRPALYYQTYIPAFVSASCYSQFHRMWRRRWLLSKETGGWGFEWMTTLERSCSFISLVYSPLCRLLSLHIVHYFIRELSSSSGCLLVRNSFGCVQANTAH